MPKDGQLYRELRIVTVRLRRPLQTFSIKLKVIVQMKPLFKKKQGPKQKLLTIMLMLGLPQRLYHID